MNNLCRVCIWNYCLNILKWVDKDVGTFFGKINDSLGGIWKKDSLLEFL